MFSGPGRGVACAACGVRVTADQIGIEVLFTRLGDQKSLQEVMERLRTVSAVPRYYLHMRCFAAWEFERTKVAHAPSNSLADVTRLR
jgi:hypothetical protein